MEQEVSYLVRNIEKKSWKVFLTHKFSEDLLIPSKEVKFAYDKNYIFANIGIIGKYYKDEALSLLRNDVEFI